MKSWLDGPDGPVVTMMGTATPLMGRFKTTPRVIGFVTEGMMKKGSKKAHPKKSRKGTC